MIHIDSVLNVDTESILLRFSDDSIGRLTRADLAKRPHGAKLQRLREPDVFSRAQLDPELETLVWNVDGEPIDLAPTAIYALAHHLPHPESIADARANELEVSLRELRRIAGKTQAEAAESAGWHQTELSKFERRNDHLLSKLRGYVQSMGWELEVTAVHGDKRLRLRGV